MMPVDRDELRQVFEVILTNMLQVLEGVAQEDESTFGTNLRHVRLVECIKQARESRQERIEGILSYLFSVGSQSHGKTAVHYWLEITLNADVEEVC